MYRFSMWYLFIDGEKVGPISDEQIKAQIKDGLVIRTSLVWRDGWPDWNQLYKVPELNDYYRDHSPQASSAQAPEANDDAMQTLVFGQALNLQIPDAPASKMPEPKASVPAPAAQAAERPGVKGASASVMYALIGAIITLCIVIAFLSLQKNEPNESAPSAKAVAINPQPSNPPSPPSAAQEVELDEDEDKPTTRARRMVITEPLRPSEPVPDERDAQAGGRDNRASGGSEAAAPGGIPGPP